MRRLLNFLRGKRLDDDIREEMEFHRTQTTGTFGNVTAIQERVRDASTVIWLETLIHDVRYAIRQFGRAPVLVAVAILSLALGIGANTAVFTLINTVMAQWLPVQQPERLVLFYDGMRAGEHSGTSFPGDSFSYSFWQYLTAHNEFFEGLCAFRQGNDSVVMHIPGKADNGPREAAAIHLVSGNYFPVLGVRPAIGRMLGEEDDRLTAPLVAVMSYRSWTQRFNRDSGLIGKRLVLNGLSVSIVGVAAPEFFGERIESPPDFWLPLSAQPAILHRGSLLAQKDMYWLNMMGRLKPGMTLRGAEAGVNVRIHQFFLNQAGSQASPAVRRAIKNVHVGLKPGGSGISGLRLRYSEPLHLLMAVVAVVLMVACANIATLLLARAAARQPEFLARLALGASRVRLLRQVLTESVLLSLLSALLGLAFAWWSVKLLMAWMRVDPVVAVKPDAAVLAFTLVVSLLTGIVFGIAPAIKSSGTDLRPGSTVRNARFGGASVLIVLQVSLSMVLLLGSALLARSLMELVRQNLGFQRENVLIIRTDPKLAEYRASELLPLYRELDGRMNAIPGVISASVAEYSPVSGSVSEENFSIQGYTPSKGSEMNVYNVKVGPHFFDALGIPIVLGRAIRERDTAASMPVAVVNETFVKMYLPGQDPLGKVFSHGEPFRPPGTEIVGVAKDTKYYDLRDQMKPMAYYSLWQASHGEFSYADEVLLRTSHEAVSIAPEARRVMKRISSKLPVLNITTLSHQVEESVQQQRLIAGLCGALGIVALVLASIGIYGTVAYSVARRTSEIGIRMAIGAPRGRVLWMVIRDSVACIALGMGLGLPMAFIGIRWIKSLLFGVSADDPLAIGTAVLLIVLMGMFAAYLPARRATKIDPMSALKYE